MSDWECGVCGFIHKELSPPEKCPVCEAPEKMFIETPGAQDEKTEEKGVPKVEKNWRCTVSGYLHKGTEPPEKCPICDASADMFEEVTEDEATEPVKDVGKRWRCTVCGYVHAGEEPPEKCPICAAPKQMFVEIDADGKAIGELAVEEDNTTGDTTSGNTVQKEPSLFDRLSNLVVKHHLHPITVHFPNGVLPVVLVFLCLAAYFNIAVLEVAAYYNLIFVLVTLPVVMLTGFIEWQKRYKGIKTAIFITKIICSIVVIASANILVFWRVIDPTVASEGSPSQLIYLALAAVMLGAAGIAGHLGGKLVFGSRG